MNAMENPHDTQAMVRVLPVLGIRAVREGLGGAFRAWTLMRHWDPAGSGAVNKKEIEPRAIACGLTKRRWRRWVKEAIQAGFIRPAYRQIDGEQQTFYRLTGAVRVALSLGVERLGNYAAEIDISLFIRRDWRSSLWAAYVATLDQENPTSREIMRLQTGVPETTQRRYENAQRDVVIRTPNYAVTNTPAKNLEGFRENCVPHAFAYYDGEREVCAYRLPDSRRVQSPLVRGLDRRGSNYRMNKQLRNALASWGQGTGRLASVRLFHNSYAGIRRAFNKMRCLDIQEKPYRRRDRLYERLPQKTHLGAQLWYTHV